MAWCELEFRDLGRALWLGAGGAPHFQGEYPALDEILASYIAKTGTVNISTDGRVKAIEAPAAAPAPAPAPTPAPAPAPAPAPMASPAAAYTVQAGDMLWKIAQSFGVEWKALSDYNHLKNPNLILPGQVLQIPAH